MRFFLAVAALGISTAAGEAQNAISGQLLAASQDERNFTFTALLRINNEKCDFVVHTRFNGSVGEIDDWGAKCLDGNMYSFRVPTNVNEVIQLMNCKELRVTTIMTASKKQPPSCQLYETDKLAAEELNKLFEDISNNTEYDANGNPVGASGKPE